MIGTADRAEADGRLAIFAIVTRPTPKSLRLLGTGFYLQLKGGFATAAHVALEAQALLSANSDSVGIGHTLPDGRVIFRPIWRFFAHPTADVAFGIPRADIINDRTGEAYRAKVLSLNSTPPELGAAISTWSYPLHRVVGEETTGQFLQLQPDFYNGALEELFTDRGPSVKVMPLIIAPASTFMLGRVADPSSMSTERFCSYDGAEDIAFVTPAGALLDVQVPEKITEGSDGISTVSLRDIAALGQLSAR
jgi:hypothetical protein